MSEEENILELKARAFDVINLRSKAQLQVDELTGQLDGLLRQINSPRETVPEKIETKIVSKNKVGKPLHKKTQKAYDAVFKAIKNKCSKHGEIMKESGVSTNAVYKMIALLEKHGKIVENSPGKYVVVENDDDTGTDERQEQIETEVDEAERG